MKLSRTLLALAVLAGLAGVAYVSQRTEAPAAKMADAAQKFLGTLGADLKARATFPFDSDERTNWHFVPLQAGKGKNAKATRKGLPLEDMNADQKKAALDLVKAGTSP